MCIDDTNTYYYDIILSPSKYIIVITLCIVYILILRDTLTRYIKYMIAYIKYLYSTYLAPPAEGNDTLHLMKCKKHGYTYRIKDQEMCLIKDGDDILHASSVPIKYVKNCQDEKSQYKQGKLITMNDCLKEIEKETSRKCYFFCKN